jgi:hypothetical protein
MLLIPVCFLFASVGVFSQETEAKEEPAPPERNIFADAGYAGLGIITSNIFLNFNTRLGDQPYANMTFEKIWKNLSTNTWIWEKGDRFLVNQFGHPYQGSTYFTAARINGFSFYESMVFAPLGSLMWEVLLEPEPAVNDLITTTVGGIPLGEILHRLFLEVDSSPSIIAKIGGFLVSPISGLNRIYNRPARETGGGNIYSLSVSSGIEKSFAFFKGHEEQANAWLYPGAHVNVNIAYGNPFVQQSKTPYDHFELYTGITMNLASYHAVIISDGYLFSFNPVQKATAFTSTGLSLHFDFYNATNDLIDNLGYGNIQFSNSAIGWALKRQHLLSGSSFMEIKVHAAFTFWGNSMYNTNEYNYDYWVSLGNNRNTYGMGENVKFSFAFSHNKAGRLEIAAYGYHIFVIPVNHNFSKGNVLFLYSSLTYDLPLGEKICIGAKGTFWGLLGQYYSTDNVNRSLVSNCLYVKFML